MCGLFYLVCQLSILHTSLVVSWEAGWWRSLKSKYNSSSSPHGMLISGVSANHFNEIHQMVGSAQLVLPENWSITIYDLIGDLSSDQTMTIQTWCRVKLRRFVPPTGFHGAELKKLTNSSWKAIIIQDAFRSLPLGSIVLYTDASSIFRSRFEHIIEHTRQVGFSGRKTSSPVSQYTHPDTIKALSKILPKNASSSDILSYIFTPVIAGGISFWLVDPAIEELVLEPLLQCSLNDACILPKGASGYRGSEKRKCIPSLSGTCHRGDQSVLSVILFGYYTESFLNESKIVSKEISSHPYDMKQLSNIIATKSGGHAASGKMPRFCSNSAQENSTSYIASASTNVLLGDDGDDDNDVDVDINAVSQSKVLVPEPIYIILSFAHEGMSEWLYAVQELIWMTHKLSVDLSRKVVFVVPCVLNARIDRCDLNRAVPITYLFDFSIVENSTRPFYWLEWNEFKKINSSESLHAAVCNVNQGKKKKGLSNTWFL